MKKSLIELYNSPHGKVSDKWALYLREYDRLFDSFRDRKIRLFEIGVQNGGSLEIWSKYFENHTVLVGCDINKDCKKLRYQDDRIRVIVGDANSLETKEKVTSISESFDIIIDDGSHTSGDIIKAFANYFPAVNNGGLFIAEDLHCSYWKEYDGGLNDQCSAISFFKLLADIINFENWGLSHRRLDLIADIIKKYDIRITDEELETIHSVEFINSMVVVRKSAITDNILGLRVIAGENELVVKGFKNLENKYLIVPAQSSTTSKKTISDITLAKLTDVAKHLGIVKSADKSKKPHIFKKLDRSIRKRAKKIFQKKIEIKTDYQQWLEKHEVSEEIKSKSIRERLGNLKHQPLISVIMPCYNSNLKWLKEAIESVRNQVYPNWELCIADDASTHPGIRSVLKKYCSLDSRIKVLIRQTNGHISAASNTALSMAEGEWIALLDHDDILTVNALFELADAINENPNVRLIYSDEDKIDGNGNRFSPHFKSDWNPDLFFSQNYICHLMAIHTSVINNVNGFRTGVEGSQDYDLILRCLEHLGSDQIHHIPKILYHWRAITGSAALDTREKNYASEAGIKSLRDYFSKSASNVIIEMGINPTTYRVKYPIPEQQPLVSLIIPTRDQLSVTKKCIKSILEKTNYKHFEIIIIDNLSSDKETHAFFDKIQGEHSNVKILRYEEEFNYSAINNFAVNQCQGSIIGLINNDVEVSSPEWLTEMVSHALRAEIGCVGAKLLYPNGTIQHGGVILGIGGVAGHSHKHFRNKHPGYFSRLLLTQNLSAVTAACLIVRRQVFDEVGGLDDTNLKIAFNDVDFCMKVSEAGYRNLWTPYAEMFHHESASRGYEDTPEKVARFNSEVNYMIQKWGDKLLNDRYYNINLTLKKEDFDLK